MNDTTNGADFADLNDTAKLEGLARKVARAVRRRGLTYDEWRKLNRRVRRLAGLTPTRKGRKLPHVLTDEQLADFFRQVDKAPNPTHALMLRLLFQTAVRVSELCGMKVCDVDLTRCVIRINEGKGGKDRYVLFGERFALTLRTYLANHKGECLFQSRQGGAYTPRRVQQIVKQYAGQAGVKATPHTFRHQAITYLTRCGLLDAELQLITGHARRETLAVYQHVALDGRLTEKYQAAMKDTP